MTVLFSQSERRRSYWLIYRGRHTHASPRMANGRNNGNVPARKAASSTAQGLIPLCEGGGAMGQRGRGSTWFPEVTPQLQAQPQILFDLRSFAHVIINNSVSVSQTFKSSEWRKVNYQNKSLVVWKRTTTLTFKSVQKRKWHNLN